MTDLYENGIPQEDEEYLTEEQQQTKDAADAELLLLEHAVVVAHIKEAISQHISIYKNNEIADWVIEALEQDDNVFNAKENYEVEYGVKWEQK